MSQIPNKLPTTFNNSTRNEAGAKEKVKVGQIEDNNHNQIELNPNVIPSEDVNLFLTLSMIIDARLKKGRYAVVYAGRFGPQFSLNKLLDSANNWHQIYLEQLVKQEKNVEEIGAHFAVKYMDIVARKACLVEDIDERVRAELNFVRTFNYKAPGGETIVRIYFVLATTSSRHYVFMEKADDNLQCLLADYIHQGKTLPLRVALDIFVTLIVAIRSMHAQAIAYKMLRLSNVLVFYDCPQEHSRINNSSNGVLKTFKVKITDFVSTVTELKSKPLAQQSNEIEQDLNDLYHLHFDLLKNCIIENVSGLYQFREHLRKCLIGNDELLVTTPRRRNLESSVKDLDIAQCVTCKFRDQ